MDCGLSCLVIVSLFHGKQLNQEHIRQACFLGKNGVSLLNLISVKQQKLSVSRRLEDV